MNRIKFADDSSGTINVYTFAYNPVAIECEDSVNSLKSKCIGSETVTYVLPFDNRPITFIWKNWNYNHSTFSGMVNALFSGLNQKKYINLMDIQPMFKNIFATGWCGPYRIEDVSPVIGSEGGYSWDEVKLIIHKV